MHDDPRPDAALEALGRAMDLGQAVQDRRVVAVAPTHLARSLLEKGDRDAAQEAADLVAALQPR